MFQLGTAYSESMKATFLDEHGKPAPLQMGCYGIGVTRILGAAIEQNFDDKGIVWPTSIALTGPQSPGTIVSNASAIAFRLVPSR